eukprot:scaffold27466_cov48-Phaeocystis_antarctica.AAC.2
MGTVDTGRASKFRLSERQVGWRLPYPRLRRRPSISGPRFMPREVASKAGEDPPITPHTVAAAVASGTGTVVSSTAPPRGSNRAIWRARLPLTPDRQWPSPCRVKACAEPSCDWPAACSELQTTIQLRPVDRVSAGQFDRSEAHSHTPTEP